MRGSAFIAFFGISAAISGALVGCGGDDDEEAAAPAKAAKVTKSADGESCVTTNDCAEGLACFSNICLDAPSGTGGSGTGGSSTGGKGGTASTLGGVGESCTRRADCNLGLGCFNQRCSTDGSGMGGGPGVTTQGERGETCLLSSDCEAPLVCLPGGSGPGNPGVGFVGICSDRDTDVEPTGNDCHAECLTPDDCCELPIEAHATTGAKSCTDLADLIGTGDCSTAAGATTLSVRCFAQAAYCECARNTWTCTAGNCGYNAACTVDNAVMGGCPTVSRTGRPLTSVCDTVDSNRCRPPAGTTICDVDADCSGLQVIDDMTVDLCVDDECVCYQNNCYRKCAENLDCARGQECDMGDEVCVSEGQCTSDLNCQAISRDIRATCTNGTCAVPCGSDLDCNPLGLTGSFTQVCNAQGMCEVLGCTQDSDCPAGTNGTRLFCSPRVAGVAGVTAHSAITD